MGESTLERTPQDFPTSFRLDPQLAHVLVALICVARGLATWPPRSPGPVLHQSLRSRLPHTLCVWAAVSASCVCFLLAGIVLLGDLLDPPLDDVQTDHNSDNPATTPLLPACLHPFSDGTFATRV